MIDREKVLKGLEYCTQYGYLCGRDCHGHWGWTDSSHTGMELLDEYRTKCPYGNCETGCVKTLAKDAFALLKAQELPTSESISSAIECLLHPRDADDSDMAKAIDVAVHAMRLSKVSEPRVMTLEEIPDTTFGWMEASEQLIPCVLEDTIYVDDTVGFASIEDGHDYMCESDYGKTWRVWTSRPTDEQREATPWMT